ncbi:calmodulin-binding protein 60 B-like [Ananas comosus]|uniref:Calmodulin-binding protein 60 B-like n=1 Tax=Ananas comosus TaxID=4615 RepID=A0A6P5FXU8_ANACO|nr:calmodulin-binding protein 60 B-like [Ananas comosus]
MQRPMRLERSGTMTREKRGLDAAAAAEGEDLRPEPKRQKAPALASVIVEALKLDSLQKLCSSLEPILRRVVSEEVERALVKLCPTRIAGRSSPKRIEGPDGRNLQLHFRSRLSLPLFTGGKVEGEQGAAIHVVLLDASTNCVVTTGPESCAKLDIVVLEGDFNNEDDEGWTEEEFESHVVKEREGKRPLLTGDLHVNLKEGVGTMGEITFTDNSSWIRSRKFRLGLKVSLGFCEGTRIREGKTEAFTVKDHRGELYKKHYPPALKDDVWRLEKIGKDGSFHKRLNKCGIYSVEDFLRLLVRDSQRLRNILGSGMSNKMWESLVEHAKTCVLSGKYYIYYSDETRSIGAIFNNIYEFCGLIASGQYYSVDSLNDTQKLFADTLVKKAYDNWMNVIEYDGKALLNSKPSKKTTPTLQNEAPPVPANYPASYDQHVSQTHISALAPLEHQPSTDTGIPGGDGTISAGYNGNQVTRYSTQPQQLPSNSHTQFHNSSLTPHEQLIGSNHQPLVSRNDNMGLASGHSIQQSALDGFFSEEEIRMRSNEMLENEDMQQLLRVFSMGGNSVNLPEDGYCFQSYIPSPCPNFNFDEDRSRASGKAVVGWLKIKAAMRWGIFVRKKAAERRAQLVEIED